HALRERLSVFWIDRVLPHMEGFVPAQLFCEAERRTFIAYACRVDDRDRMLAMGQGVDDRLLENIGQLIEILARVVWPNLGFMSEEIYSLFRVAQVGCDAGELAVALQVQDLEGGPDGESPLVVRQDRPLPAARAPAEFSANILPHLRGVFDLVDIRNPL